ncbi:MAG: hypothetical protein R6V49_04995 [Bacteroidales bacterium]
MKKVFLTLALAAIFTMGFVSCGTKTTEEGDAMDTVAVEQPIEVEVLEEEVTEEVVEEVTE